MKLVLKKLPLIGVLCLTSTTYAQTEIKVNTVFAPLGVLNIV